MNLQRHRLLTVLTHGSHPIGQEYPHVRYNNSFYYTSREDTLILLDERHVSRLLATRVSVGCLTAVTIQHLSTCCQVDDVLAPVVMVLFYDSLYCWGRHASRSPRMAKCVNAWAKCRRQQWDSVVVENDDRENYMRECLYLEKKVKCQPRWDGRLFGMIKQVGHPSMVSMVNLLLRYCTAKVNFVSFNLS